MKKFAYLFPLGGKIEWSIETEDSLPTRADTAEDRTEISDFIRVSKVGWHTQLSTGEFIFRTE